MKKPVIGIVPTLTYKIGPSIFDDQFKFVNSYTKKIQKSGAVPIGLLAPDGRLNYEALNLCDGFLIPGGNMVRKYIYEILYYSMKNDVPILGVCLGAQAISIFSALIDKLNLEKDLTYEKIKEIYSNLKAKNGGKVLVDLPDDNMHVHDGLTRDNLDEARHPIRIHQGTLLHDIYQKSEIKVASFHSYDFKFVQNGFVASAYASDGVKEAIEYQDPNKFVLGVHFHPEIDEDNIIFDRLSYEAAKRKK